MAKEGLPVEEIVENLQRGTEVDQSFQLLFDRYFQPIVTYFTRQGLSLDDSRELAQETFLRAYQSIGSFEGKASLATWLFRIAANVFRNEIRNRNARKRKGWQVSLNGDNSTSRETRSLLEISRENPGADILEEILAQERVQALAREIERLSPQARRCIFLRNQGRTYREIAIVLQIATGTVKSHVHHARKQLMERLQSYFDFDGEL
jgi:RNA polymerase sigma-70 factor (ECF subfamily)